jgi:hypothetical protein
LRFPGFIGPSYTLQSVNVDCQRTVNLFPEMDQLGTGKEGEVAALVPTPGLELLLTLPESPVRGVWRASNGQVFAVGGGKFYSISSTWAATEIGSLQTTSGAVSIADNGLHVIVVDGTYGYTWTIASSTWAQIVSAGFYPSDLVTFQDGYFILHRKGTQVFFISGLNDITFDPLDFGTAEGSPDNLVGVMAMNQSVYLFGSQSTEVFYDSGNVDFPFERIQGAINDVGCAAPFTVAKLQNQVYFVGGDSTGSGIVYRMQNFQPERISTPAIEAVIRSIDPTTLSSARAWTYQQGGHAFFCLNLPGIDSTYCYDASTGLWHERAFLNLWSLERHRADCHAVAFGKNIVGDYQTGKIYALDPDTVTDNGTSIARIRTAPHLSKGLMNVFHSSFQLDMETGVGTDGSGQGVNPQVMLRWSDDGGHSWSNERWADAGRIGNRKTRALFRRLGASRDRVYEVRITDPVKVVLLGAELGIEPGVA